MKNKLFLNGYIGFSLFYLLIVLLGREEMAWFLKPFLIPFLLLAVYFCESFPSKKILLTALLFSWIGDIILMFTDRGELYFIFGLLAFLLSHIVYIFVFNNQSKTETNKSQATFGIGVGVIIAYLALMLFILLPKLGDLKIPVIVYAMVISTMLLFAFKGSLNWPKPANNIILLGAIFFVSSDSILAFNKFYCPVPLSSFLIMITYITAQYLIVNGILKLNQKK